MTQPTDCRIAWFNGKFMPENQVLISFRDRSWRYGDGVFDMTRTFNGLAFRLKEHIERLYRSLRYLRLDPGMSPQEMIDVSEEIVARNEHLARPVSDMATSGSCGFTSGLGTTLDLPGSEHARSVRKGTAGKPRRKPGLCVRMDISYCTAIVTVFDDTPSILRLNGTAGPGVIVTGTSAFT
jgi:hypothetical protein